MISASVALLGAFVYGSADFLGGLAARRLRSIVVAALAAASGLAALVVILPVLGGEWRARDVALGVVAGLFVVVALALLYACLAIGPMSILSPLTAVVSAIAPMLWGLLLDGETLAPLGYLGLAVALVAVVLVGFIPGEKVVRPSIRGLVMACGAGLAIGAFLIVIDQTSDASGLVPLIMSRSTSVIVTVLVVTVLVMVALRRGKPAASVLDAAGSSAVTDTRRRALWLAIACGVLDAAANALTLVALRTGDLSIVAALTALYPAGTILLAAIVLRERVATVQWSGLVLALIAGGMLAVA